MYIVVKTEHVKMSAICEYGVDVTLSVVDAAEDIESLEWWIDTQLDHGAEPINTNAIKACCVDSGDTWYTLALYSLNGGMVPVQIGHVRYIE